MIVDGQAVAMKFIDGADKQVYEYKPGDYFGERALLTNDARAASIVVTVSSLIILYIFFYSQIKWLLFLWIETRSRGCSDLSRISLAETWTSITSMVAKSFTSKILNLQTSD